MNRPNYHLTSEMAKRKSKKIAAAATDIKDANHDRKMKPNQFPTILAKRRENRGLRMQMFNRKKGEEELRKGMTIRNIFLQSQGFDVKEDEDKSEKYEFDAYKHAKKIQNGELTIPSRPASIGRISVSSHHPVRAMMRKFTRKTIAKVIKTLEEKVQIEENRKKVDVVFKRLYARNDPATRRAKAAFQKIMGKEFQPVVRREEKLGFLIQPRAASRQLNMRTAVSSRAKAVFQKSQ